MHPVWWLLFASWACVNAIKNPAIPGWNPDPSILRVGDEYFVATSTFTVYPGIPIYKSTDLANWELISHAINRPENVQLYGTATTFGVWAPSLSYIDGLFYVTSVTWFGSSTDYRTYPRMWWISSPDLINWSDIVWGEPNGIDPQLFRDPISNKTYLNLMKLNNSYDRLWGIGQCEVNLQTGKCVDRLRSLWNGTLQVTNSSRPEGPKMFYKDDYYYLILAEGGTGSLHRVTIGRSDSPEGPWEAAPNNPLIYNGAYPNLTIQSTGHATFVETPNGTWYASLLARRNIASYSPLGRETFIVEVTWGDDGWPTMNGGQPLLLSETIPGPDQPLPPAPFVDDFAGPDLGLSWYQLRSPYTQNYQLGAPAGGNNSAASAGGGVVLRPNAYTLSDRDTPAALLHKQTSLNMTFSATLLPTDDTNTTGGGGGGGTLGPLQSVGISAYINEYTHQDTGVRGCAATAGLCLFTDLRGDLALPQDRPNTTEWPLNRTAIPAGLALHVRVLPLTYRLGYSLGKDEEEEDDDDVVVWTAEFDSSLMSPGNTFDGPMLTLFASGNGEPWPFDAPDVGFRRVQEIYYEENIGDYDDW